MKQYGFRNYFTIKVKGSTTIFVGKFFFAD